MKRCVKFAIIMAFFFVFEVWIYFNLDFLYTISLPIVLLALVAIYACIEIFGSIAYMKPNPNEKQHLQRDIDRAKSYYQSEGLSFEQ